MLLFLFLSFFLWSTSWSSSFFFLLSSSKRSLKMLLLQDAWMQYQPNLVTRTTDRSFTKVAYQIGVKGHVGLTKVNDLFFQILTKNASSSRFLMQYQPNLVTRTTEPSFIHGAFCQRSKVTWGSERSTSLYFIQSISMWGSKCSKLKKKPGRWHLFFDSTFRFLEICKWANLHKNSYTSSKVYRPGYQNVANLKKKPGRWHLFFDSTFRFLEICKWANLHKNSYTSSKVYRPGYQNVAN